MGMAGWRWEAAASRDAMEIQYRVFGGDTLRSGGGTLNRRIECPGETLETRWGHFSYDKVSGGTHLPRKKCPGGHFILGGGGGG